MEVVTKYYSAVQPYALCVASSLFLYLKMKSVEDKQNEILEEVSEIKAALSREALADAIIQATNTLEEQEKEKKKDKKSKKDKKNKKDKKDKKDKKGKKDKKDKKKDKKSKKDKKKKDKK